MTSEAACELCGQPVSVAVGRSKHLRAARLECLEAVKSLAQARIDQIKEGSKKSKLKRIEVK